jgi:hypothetical protein
MTPSPLSPPLKGGEIILSPRPLGERVRVRGTFGSMTNDVILLMNSYYLYASDNCINGFPITQKFFIAHAFNE